MHEHFPGWLMTGVLALQRRKQTVEVLAVLARRVTFGLRQGVHRIAQLHLQMGNQRRGQGHDKAFDILGKTITVHR